MEIILLKFLLLTKESLTGYQLYYTNVFWGGKCIYICRAMF